MPGPEVTILIPNYKTLQLTRLCLELIRKHTDPQRIHIIAIDNDSRDESLDYLRSLSWIELIERKTAADDNPALSHGRALDFGLKRVSTPFVLSIHTDTLVKHSRWLDVLLAEIEKGPDIAGVGSWKLESKPFLKRLAKSLEYRWQSFYYDLIGKTDHALEGKGDNYRYLRSHCALYRMQPIRDMNLSFSGEGETAGKVMHKKLVDSGYRMIFLPSHFLNRYIVHVNHATMVIRPELGARRKTIIKGQRRMQKEIDSLRDQKILSDDLFKR